MATDTHPTEHHGEAHGDLTRTYLVIFAALSVFTIVSFVVNGAVRSESLSRTAGFAIILGVAVVKAVLVATYFMHLIFDWRRFYFVIVPALILGTLLVIVLLPDIVLAWHH